MDKDLTDKVKTLQKDLADLIAEMYRNNFSGSQQFNKAVDFNVSLKIPRYSELPVRCETGEVIIHDTKLYICAAPNSWVIVGTQS